MCGIAGIQYFDLRPLNNEIIRNMTMAMIHRGPDAEGFFISNGIALGHRRLSIIDIKSGIQPMANHSGSLHIVFNGEIYNHKELKYDLEKKGFKFKTESDTEVILASYQYYGEEFVKHLNGMFAIAIWDSAEKKLILARDRIGKKPLFYHATNCFVVFSSEIKSLMQFPGIPKEIDNQAIDDYFSLGYIPENICIYKSIHKLPPAHIAIIQSGKVSIKQFWEVPRSNIISGRSDLEYIEELTYLLKDSVKIRMLSDVPIGAFLSGGIDSSTVTALMALASNGPINTFSIQGGEGEFNELPYANAVAKMYDTNHRTLNIPPQELPQLLHEVVSFFDEPFGDSSMIPTYMVSKLARENITVALSGEGGDELFAGYDWHKRFCQAKTYKMLLPLYARNIIDKGIFSGLIEPRVYTGSVRKLLHKIHIANTLSLGQDHDGYRSLLTAFSPHVKSLILNREFFDENHNVNDIVKDIFHRYHDEVSMTKALKTDLQLYLPSDLLVKVDRMSMANSLEVRCPLLDYRLIEFSTRVPNNLKLRNGTSKYILRQAAKKFLPEVINNRTTKRGFSIPVSTWFREKYAEYAKSILLDRSFPLSHLFNFAGIELMLNRHKNQEYDYGPFIWYLLSFVLWSKSNLS